MEINNIVILGSGNLATNLALAVHKSGKKISGIYSRNILNAKALAQKCLAPVYTDNLSFLPDNADIYIVSVKDDAITDVLLNFPFKNKLIVHTSGNTELDVFKNKFSDFGVIYPLMTFRKEILSDFSQIPLCIEAVNTNVLKLIEGFSSALTDKIHYVNSIQRKHLHLAAVFACNFTNYNYVVAEEILSEHQLSFDIIKPLILKTAENICQFSPAKLQTGPAVRKDFKVIEMQKKLLKMNESRRKIYKLFTDCILDLKTKNEKL